MKPQDAFLDQQRQNQTKNQALTNYNKGLEAYDAGKIDVAIEEFTTAISLQLTNVAYYFVRAKCYFAKKDYHKYVFDLSLAMHVDNLNFVLYIARSQGLYMLKQYDQALIDLDSALQQFKKHIQIEDEQIKSNPKVYGNLKRTTSNTIYATIYYRRGVCNFALRNLQQCISDFTQCIGILEAFGPAYARRGAAHLMLKHSQEALGDLKTAVAKCTQNVYIHQYRLGQAFLRVGMNQQAVEALTAAIDGSANGREAAKRHGDGFQKPPTDAVYFCGTKFDLFRFEAPDALKVDDCDQNYADQQRQQYPEFTATRGKAKALLGKFGDALADFQASSQMDSNNAETYFEKSTANRIMGNYKQALEDIEKCATLMLNSNVAYNKAIILENNGDIDGALRIYEAILEGVFKQNFQKEHLQRFSAAKSVIDAVIEESQKENKQPLTLLKNEDQIVDKHLGSLYHAALLHRQKLHHQKALHLIDQAIIEDQSDERYYDLKAIILLDLHFAEQAIEASNGSIKLQLDGVYGVNWESYFIRAIGFMYTFQYNSALRDLVSAQERPAGGLEKNLKKGDQEKVMAILMKLPPGSPLSIAYQNANNVDSIPKDPLSPSSAARGIGNVHQVFPMLDLHGALPGFHNQFILKRKAECLFVLQDYIGCVRTISQAFEDFQYNEQSKNGKRLINRAFYLIRSNQEIRLEQTNSAKEQIIDEYAIDAMQEQVQVILNESEQEHLYDLYFLRGRALSMLNRFPHAIKDCQRALYIFKLDLKQMAKQNQDEQETTLIVKEDSFGSGSLQFFLSKLYAYIRKYTKSYHFARSALRCSIPYSYIHRAHYLQGVALVYTKRLELSVKCFSLALRSYFQQKLSTYIYDRKTDDKKGLIHLVSIEEISAYLDVHPEVLEDQSLKLKIIQGENIQKQKKQVALPINNDIHRMQVPKCFPTDAEVANNKKLEQLRLELLEKMFLNSDLNGLEFDNEPLQQFILMQHKTDKPTMLQRINTPITWCDEKVVFYLHERAKCLQELGLHEMAVDDFTVVLQFQPLNDRAYFRRGFSLKQIGMFEQAVADFEKARQLRPDLQVYQISYVKIGNIGYIELVPPGNEENYDGTKSNKIDAQKPINKFFYDLYDTNYNVNERRKDGSLNVEAFKDKDIWDVVGDFGILENVDNEINE